MYTELEKKLFESDEKDFPPVSADRGEVPYIDKYKGISTALQPIHASVEKNALASSLIQYIEQIKKEKSQKDVEMIIDNIPVVYLNNHGHGHVERNKN